jgi:hypothetical protein
MSTGFTITSNFEEFAKELSSRKSELNTIATGAMRKGMLYFKGQIEKDFYSGRKSSNLGLNRHTSGLVRGWHISSTMTGRGGLNTSVKLSNSEKYGLIHEKGGTIKPINGKFLTFKIKNPHIAKSGKTRGFDEQWVRVKSVKIPKRTYVEESWYTSGFDIVKKTVRSEINKVLKIRSNN